MDIIPQRTRSSALAAACALAAALFSQSAQAAVPSIALILGVKGSPFDDALASFAMAYAEQTVKDYAASVKAKGGAKAEASPKVAKPARKSA